MFFRAVCLLVVLCSNIFSSCKIGENNLLKETATRIERELVVFLDREDDSLVFKKGDSIPGTVIRILDGDTYDALVKGNKTIRIRMNGIDAPEKGMPFYRVSKNYLGELCFRKEVKIKILDIDRYGRMIAFTYLKDGRELSHEMIRAGLAWHYKQYNKDRDLAQLERQARAGRTGLWADKNPMEPWRNRGLHRQGISTKDSFDLREGKR